MVQQDEERKLRGRRYTRLPVKEELAEKAVVDSGNSTETTRARFIIMVIL